MSNKRHIVSFAIAAVFALAVTSCSDESTQLTECSSRVPVAMFTQTLRDQADVVGDTSATSVQQDLAQTISALTIAEKDASSSVDASLKIVINALLELQTALSETKWDVANATAYESVSQALAQIESPTTADANLVVESYLLQRCGAQSVVVDDSSVQTLPTPTGAVTSDTDPQTGVVDNDSDKRAIGLVVGQLFGLTLNTTEVDCLGGQLQNFVDLSDASSSPSQYQRQFQKAFDSCGIRFTVPTE